MLDVGIASIGDLRRSGSAAVYATIVRQGVAPATLNLLYALEAAIRDTDWRELPDPVKRRVKGEAEELLKT